MPREGELDDESDVSGYGRSSSDVDPGADGYGPRHHRVGGRHHLLFGGWGWWGPLCLWQRPGSVQSGGGGGLQTPATGGSAILLPAAVLLLGSGILTYAFLRRR
jgi:hypothetical protein